MNTTVQEAIFMLTHKNLDHWTDAHDEVAIAALRAQPASLPRLSEAQIDRILCCLDPDDGGHDEIAKFLGDYLRAQPDHSELIAKLRSDVQTPDCDCERCELLREAANALEGK